ncbi:MAG: hypothetical protein HY319_13170 [Armatimonadetes bacterium]|nr:hypothetical protein [Armatimonadota bacterium]
MTGAHSQRKEARARLFLLLLVAVCLVAYAAWVVPRLQSRPIKTAEASLSPTAPALPAGQEENLPPEALEQLDGELSLQQVSEAGRQIEFRLQNGSGWTVNSLLVALEGAGRPSQSVLLMPGSPSKPGRAATFTAATELQEVEAWKIVAASGLAPPAPSGEMPVAASPAPEPSVAAEGLAPQGSRARGSVAEFAQSSESGVLKLQASDGKNLVFTLNPSELSLPEGAPTAGDEVEVIYRRSAEGLNEAVEIRPAASATAPEGPVPTFSDPVAMLHSYYELLHQDRYQEAYSLRSSASQAETSYDEFVKAWDYNKKVRLEEVSILEDSGERVLAEIWIDSQDADKSGGANRRYRGRVKLVQDGQGWRYDRGDFTVEEE